MKLIWRLYEVKLIGSYSPRNGFPKEATSKTQIEGKTHVLQTENMSEEQQEGQKSFRKREKQREQAKDELPKEVRKSTTERLHWWIMEPNLI